MKVGDKVAIGGLVMGADLYQSRAENYYTLNMSDIRKDCVIPEIPNLAAIVTYLAEHPETVEALEEMIDDLMGFCHQKSVDTVSGLLRAMRGEAG